MWPEIIDRITQMERTDRTCIRMMRRWGLRWRTIAKCILGFHGRPWVDPEGIRRCGRCGALL